MEEFLFEDLEKEWEKLWKEMPEFKQKKLKPYKQVILSFVSKKDMEDFSKLIQQKITEDTKYVIFPKQKMDSFFDNIYISERNFKKYE